MRRVYRFGCALAKNESDAADLTLALFSFWRSTIAESESRKRPSAGCLLRFVASSFGSPKSRVAPGNPILCEGARYANSKDKCAPPDRRAGIAQSGSPHHSRRASHNTSFIRSLAVGERVSSENASV